MFLPSVCRKSPAKAGLFRLYAVKWEQVVREMLERGKMERDVIEIVGIASLVPEEHLLRKIEKVMDYEWLYLYMLQS